MLFALPLIMAAFAHGQNRTAATDRAITVYPTRLYVAPAAGSERLADVERGRELVIIEKSGNWLHVLANVEGGPLGADERVPQGRNVTGWVQDKGIVHLNTPNGDRIVFGEAADSEAQASQRRGRRGAAQDAMRLYSLMYEFFPQSPQAGEALFRAADIRWQIERADAFTRPSSRNPDPTMRPDLNDEFLRQVEKKFPHSKWSDLAAYDLLDQKTCSDWSGGYKCPDREAEAYEKYFSDHPQSPKAAEALYNATYRRAALVDIFRGSGDPKRSDESRSKAIADAQRLVGTFPDTDWGARGAVLLFKLNQEVPIYGNPQ